MERKHVTHSFNGFPHVVTPIQNIFSKECKEDLSSDALLFFSVLQKKLIEDMMRGACALARHRKSDTVSVEDLLCHLDAQWKIDPLLISGNSYRVEETSKEVDHSLSTLALPRGKRSSGNSEKTTSKAPKISARKLKKMEEKEAERRTLEICRSIVFKRPFPSFMKKKSETQVYNEFMSRPDIVQFFGKQLKQYSFYSMPPSIAPIYKSNSKIEKKKSLREHTRKVATSKERPQREFKIYQPNPDSLTTKMCGVQQDTSDTMSEVNYETITYNPKLKVVEKLPTGILIRYSPSKEMLRHLTKNAAQSSSKLQASKDKLLVTSPTTKGKQEVSGVDTVLKLSPEAPICKMESKIEVIRSAYDYSMKKNIDKAKLEHGFKVGKCATVGTSEIERQPSLEISSADLQVTKKSGKKRKHKGFDINAVPGETAEEARKRLAIVLLRIAGKY